VGSRQYVCHPAIMPLNGGKIEVLAKLLRRVGTISAPAGLPIACWWPRRYPVKRCQRLSQCGQILILNSSRPHGGSGAGDELVVFLRRMPFSH